MSQQERHSKPAEAIKAHSGGSNNRTFQTFMIEAWLFQGLSEKPTISTALTALALDIVSAGPAPQSSNGALERKTCQKERRANIRPE
jgi:hypothetical protein